MTCSSSVVGSLLLITGLLVSNGIRAADPSAASENVSAIGQLKSGKGRELVLAHCMPCHSSAVIAASHQSRERWDQTITRMQTQNGMWPLPAALRNQILDYLAATQPVSDPGLERAKESPWAAPLYRPNPLW